MVSLLMQRMQFHLCGVLTNTLFFTFEPKQVKKGVQQSPRFYQLDSEAVRCDSMLTAGIQTHLYAPTVRLYHPRHATFHPCTHQPVARNVKKTIATFFFVPVALGDQDRWSDSPRFPPHHEGIQGH